MGADSDNTCMHCAIPHSHCSPAILRKRTKCSLLLCIASLQSQIDLSVAPEREKRCRTFSWADSHLAERCWRHTAVRSSAEAQPDITSVTITRLRVVHQQSKRPSWGLIT